MLKTIRISNFKSISDDPVNLGGFNVLIGANASGKSNFVDALRFIHNTLDDGLSSAAGRRYGWSNVLTRGKDRTDKITVEIICDFNGPNIIIPTFIPNRSPDRRSQIAFPLCLDDAVGPGTYG